MTPLVKCPSRTLASSSSQAAVFIRGDPLYSRRVQTSEDSHRFLLLYQQPVSSPGWALSWLALAVTMFPRQTSAGVCFLIRGAEAKGTQPRPQRAAGFRTRAVGLGGLTVHPTTSAELQAETRGGVWGWKGSCN